MIYARLTGNLKTAYTTAENHMEKVEYAGAGGDGFLPLEILNEKPSVGVGEKLVYKMTAEDARVTKEYLKMPLNEAVPADVTGPRSWSRLNVKRTLDSAGKWADAKSAMEAMGIYDEFLMCNFISESDPSFIRAYGQACESYGKAAVDAILDAIPVEA